MNRTIFAIVGMSALLVNAQVAQEAASGTESLTPLQSTQATCLDQCHVADTGCRAECISVSWYHLLIQKMREWFGTSL